jgi:hypothetical protein
MVLQDFNYISSKLPRIQSHLLSSIANFLNERVWLIMILKAKGLNNNYSNNNR